MISLKDAQRLYVSKQYEIHGNLLSEISSLIASGANRGVAYIEYKGKLPNFVCDVLKSQGFIVREIIWTGGTKESEEIHTNITWYEGINYEQP